ncbi:HlyD family secretion protein [Roseovarius mucosus]|uniref:HlyD family secretion protein n=1 Tax=Roseovarius mucosus TaxID=215743 RepID=UPI001C5CFFC1|nr:HlyD family secretion protein [Roseovarius mucosus]MBW4976198.1 HlyD family secretion protein [Roseovarius mucosus]
MNRKIEVCMRVTLIGTLGLVAGLWAKDWLIAGRYEIRSDDAYVVGDIVAVAPRVSGHVTKVGTSDNASVSQGDVLFLIDDRSYKSALERAEAAVAQASAEISTLDAQITVQRSLIRQAEANLRQAQAEFDLAKLSFRRVDRLAKVNARSEASFDDAQSTLTQGEAKLDMARAALSAAVGQVELIGSQRRSAEARLAAATAARTSARIDLESTIVRAPVSGVVGNRTVQVGRFTSVGATTLNLVPLDKLWIETNVLETQLQHILPGQLADVQVDGFPDSEITGMVDSVSPGSGSAFSLFAPDNATGNFVRIVQRVPIKIRLTKVPETLRLVPGLSARVAIHIDRQKPEKQPTDPSRKEELNK